MFKWPINSYFSLHRSDCIKWFNYGNKSDIYICASSKSRARFSPFLSAAFTRKRCGACALHRSRTRLFCGLFLPGPRSLSELHEQAFFIVRGKSPGNCSSPESSARHLHHPQVAAWLAASQPQTRQTAAAQRMAGLAWIPSWTPANPRWPERRDLKIYETDLLACSECGEPMRIIAFIIDPLEVAKILAHIGEQTARAAPDANRSRSLILRLRRYELSIPWSSLVSRPSRARLLKAVRRPARSAALFADSQRSQKPWRYLPQRNCTENQSKNPKLKKSKTLNSPQSANETLKLFPWQVFYFPIRWVIVSWGRWLNEIWRFFRKTYFVLTINKGVLWNL